MRFRSMLILLIVAAAVGSYIWFYERTRPSTEEREAKDKLVFSVEPDDIDLVRLAKAGEEILCVKDKEGAWQMEKPLAYMADKAQLRSICTRLGSLSAERIIKADEIDEKKLDEFGLKEPSVTVRFRSRGEEHGISLGGDTPLGNSLYGRIDGSSDVYVLGRGVRSALEKSANELRDRGVIDFEPKEIARLRISHGGRSVELEQKDDVWRITEPIRGLADPDTANAILRTLRNLRVRDFADDSPTDLAQYGLEAPEYEVVLWSGKGGASRSVLFGKEKEKKLVYARRDGLNAVFTVSGDIRKNLARSPEEFRDRAATHLSQGAIEEISIAMGGEKIALAKSGEKWEIREPEKLEAEDGQVRELLRAITGIKALDFVADKAEDTASYGLGEGVTEITLKPKDGEAEKIFVGKKFDRDRKVYLKRGAGDEVLAVSAEFLKQCSTDPLAYRKRQLLELNSRDVKKLSVAVANKPEVSCEKGEGDEWKILAPQGAKANKAAIEAIVSGLSNLRAREFVARVPKELKAYGLDAPSIRASVEFVKGGADERATLLVGKKAGSDTYYAKLDEGDMVFTIPSYLDSNLRKDLSMPEQPASHSTPALGGGQ